MKEPFLINAPRHKPRGHRAGCGCVVCSRRKHGKRRRGRRRHNPDLMLYNPRRRHGKRRRGHRRYRRNPGGGGGGRGIFGQLKGALPDVAWGVAGAAGAEMVPGLVQKFVPIPIPGGQVGQIGVKLGAGLAVAYLVGKVAGPRAGRAALVGALLVPAAETVRTFAGPVLGIGAYTDMEPIGAYLPDRSLGYMGPGTTVGEFGDLGDSAVARLDPDARL